MDADHFNKVHRSLEKDAYPVIGSIPIKKLKRQDILAVIRNIEERGSYGIAAKVLQRIGAICRYAIYEGLIDWNPASEMRGVLKKRPVIHRRRLDKEELPEFFRRLKESRMHHVTKSVFRFIIFTGVRQIEARLATWG